MKKYDYFEAVCNDVREWLNEYKNEWQDALNEEGREAIEAELYDRLFCNDSVTGNGSGSYYSNATEAEESICHNLDLLGEALQEFGCTPDYITEKGAEACDVTIRCYLLPRAISAVLDEIENEE